MINKIKAQISSSISVKKVFLGDDELLEQVRLMALTCIGALKSGGKIIFAGNGGSFADAQHLSAELTSRFLIDRAPLASIALGTNNSAISAIGNDYGYEQVFARELQAIAKKEDVFIPISTSGNSINLLKAVGVANAIGVTTIAMTGKDGGRLNEVCNCLHIPSFETARIQECHILVGHILCELIEADFFNNQVVFSRGREQS